MATTSTSVFLLFLLLLTVSASAADSMAATPSPPRLSCARELVLFSPCLPYVSAPPNNLTASANPQCCSVFSSAVDSGAGNCLCYLLRQPMILGFPLDPSRVLSLSQICTGRSREGSLESICSPSELPELPPLQNTDITMPVDSGDGVASSSSPSVSLPPETDENSPSSVGFPPETTVRSPPQHPHSISAGTSMSVGLTRTPKTRNCWFQPAILISVLLSSCISSM